MELQHSKQLWVVCIISLFLINKVAGCIVVGGKPFLQACNKERMGGMDEIHKVVRNGCLVDRKTKSLVVGVDAIKALNDIFSIKTDIKSRTL